MSRSEFMEKLRELLSDLSETEREEALNYYEDYFDDAGVENEQEVIAALGSPEKVAGIIKEGINDPEGARGEFSERGFSSYEHTVENEVGNPKVQEETKEENRGKSRGNGKLILLLILAVFALPILGPVSTGILSLVFGIFVAAIAILFSVLIGGIGLIFAGLVVSVLSIASLFSNPPTAVLLAGVALVMLGIGIVFAILGGWIVYKTVPALIRGIVNICRKSFEKKEV